jgi:two-component system chemotaxis response regulator CheY
MKICLVVDDSRVVRKVARRIVEEIGFQCEEAEDGVEAYSYCEKQMPDAILLDWNMPNMNGLEFLEKLRAHPSGATPKVVFCTTENDMSYIQRAMGAGADEYIMKPFDGDIVQTKFEQVGLL